MSHRFFIDAPQVTNENRVSVYKLSFECGMFYIGSSLNLQRRIIQYRYNLYNRKDINKKLKAALNSHISAKIEILETCSDEKMLRGQEDYYIKLNWDNPKLLNRSISAYSNRYKMDKDERHRMGNYMRGRKLTDQQKKLWSDVKKGIVFSEQHRKNISKSRKGIVFSEEHLKKLSDAKKGKPMPEHLKELRKGKTNIPVDMFDTEGNFIKKFDSYSLAASEIGCQAGHIGEVVKGKYKSRSGFVFKKHQSVPENNK